MNSVNAALLINLLGFTVGIALYALLLMMVARHRRSVKLHSLNFLLLITSILGLLWNAGELWIFAWKDFDGAGPSSLLTAVSYAALGFLPSVVVHSAENETGKVSWLTFVAYGLSTLAAIMHLGAVAFGNVPPSDLALQLLTFGSLGLAVGLIVFNF